VGRLALPALAGPLLAVGALFALVPHGGVIVLVLSALALAAAAASRDTGRPQRVVLLGCVIVLAVGWSVGAARLQHLAADPLAARVGHVAIAVPVLVEEPWRGGGFGRIALGRILDENGGPVLLRIAETSGPRRGSILRVTGALERPRAPVTPNGFDERSWLARQGVHAVLRIRSHTVIGARGGVWGLVDAVRASALAALAPAGTGDAAQVAIGLAFGGSVGISAPAVEAFRVSGLAHLLAVSGGNIALLLALVVLVVWVLGGTRRQALALGVAVILLYMGVVGLSPSVLRAGIAGMVGCLVWLLGRPRDAWRALGLGLGLLLAWNPLAIGDPGLQLSFAAVAGILLIVPRVRPWAQATGVPVVLLGAAAVTTAATIATAPISWWHFGRATILAAIPANLMAAPAVPLALWSALVATLVTPLAPGAGAGIAWCAQWPAAWILQCAWFGAWLAASTPVWALPTVLAIGVATLAARSRH
jgi:competence protein ComEC